MFQIYVKYPTGIFTAKTLQRRMASKASKDVPQKKSDAEIRLHNEDILSRVKPGDMLQLDRGVYQHWAVFIGEGQVIHLAGEDGDMGQSSSSDIKVRVDDFWKVTKNDPAEVNNNKDERWEPFPGNEIVERARKNLDQVGYNIVFFNCEHFASWCRYGKTQSDQVDNVALTGSKLFGPSGIHLFRAYEFLKKAVSPD